MLALWRIWGLLLERGQKEPPANIAPVGRGVSCRARTHQRPKRTREVAFAHSIDATGTKGGFGGKIASIRASFVFQLAEYPHVSEGQNLVGQNMQLWDLAPSRGGDPRGNLVSLCS